MIKSAPGNVSLESMLTEIGKLDAVRAVELPDGLFADVAPKVVAGWRARAAVEAPSHLRDHPRPLMLTLLAALVYEREREITDTLADLLISTVHRIGARAERKVTQELVSEFRKVAGKESLLYRLAEAAISRPDDTVRAVVYPVAGEKTPRDLVAEYKSSGPTYRRTVQTTLRGSYTGHYRRGLIRLLEVLEFRTGSSACQPVIEAMALIRRYAAAGSLTCYPAGEHVPAHTGITEDCPVHQRPAPRRRMFLFESSWKKPYSDRGVRKILARYTQAAGITASISPHTLRHFLLHLAQGPGHRRRAHPALQRPRHPPVSGDLLPPRPGRRPAAVRRRHRRLPRLTSTITLVWAW